MTTKHENTVRMLNSEMLRKRSLIHGQHLQTLHDKIGLILTFHLFNFIQYNFI